MRWPGTEGIFSAVKRCLANELDQRKYKICVMKFTGGSGRIKFLSIIVNKK